MLVGVLDGVKVADGVKVEVGVTVNVAVRVWVGVLLGCGRQVPVALRYAEINRAVVYSTLTVAFPAARKLICSPAPRPVRSLSEKLPVLGSFTV